MRYEPYSISQKEANKRAVEGILEHEGLKASEKALELQERVLLGETSTDDAIHELTLFYDLSVSSGTL